MVRETKRRKKEDKTKFPLHRTINGKQFTLHGDYPPFYSGTMDVVEGLIKKGYIARAISGDSIGGRFAIYKRRKGK